MLLLVDSNTVAGTDHVAPPSLDRLTTTAARENARDRRERLQIEIALRAGAGDRIGGAIESPVADARESRNERAYPRQPSIAGERVTAVDGAGIEIAPFLKCREEEVWVRNATHDVRLGLAALRGGQLGRVVAETEVASDARIEDGGRAAFRKIGVDGALGLERGSEARDDETRAACEILHR